MRELGAGVNEVFHQLDVESTHRIASRCLTPTGGAEQKGRHTSHYYKTD